MTVKVGINGFGRIGRNFLRAARKSGADIDFVGVNDITDSKTLAHLLKYDSVLGRFEGEVGLSDDGLPIRSARVMRRTLQYQRLVDLPLALHEEDAELSAGGSMHEGEVSAEVEALSRYAYDALYRLVAANGRESDTARAPGPQELAPARVAFPTTNATLNWWGSATGPTTPNNPGGTGEAISDPDGVVILSPFLTSGTDTQPATPGFQPGANPPIGIVVIGTGGDDTVVFTATGTDRGSYTVNGGPVQGPFSNITSFTFKGDVGNDTLTINNPPGDLFAPSGGITFNGGTQTDVGFYIAVLP